MFIWSDAQKTAHKSGLISDIKCRRCVNLQPWNFLPYGALDQGHITEYVGGKRFYIFGLSWLFVLS